MSGGPTSRYARLTCLITVSMLSYYALQNNLNSSSFQSSQPSRRLLTNDLTMRILRWKDVTANNGETINRSQKLTSGYHVRLPGALFLEESIGLSGTELIENNSKHILEANEAYTLSLDIKKKMAANLTNMGSFKHQWNVIEKHIVDQPTANHSVVYLPTANQTITDRSIKRQTPASNGYQYPSKPSDIERDLNDLHTNKEMIVFPYTAYDIWSSWTSVMDFSRCEYRCRLDLNRTAFHKADIVIFELKATVKIKTVPTSPTRASQYWVLNAKESSAYRRNHLGIMWNGMFNITDTYRSDSTVVSSDFMPFLRQRTNILPKKDYSANKTTDMVSYVSNCKSFRYFRLLLMKRIAADFTFDIYGACNKIESPCDLGAKRSRYHNGFHSQQANCLGYHAKYRFYFAFENSLCKEYITEKFGNVLSSPDNMVPIVMGGLTMADYTRIAPPDSFIHVENFTSIAELRKHLRYLILNPEAYNKYHKWREMYETVKADKINACELCRIAHQRPKLPGLNNLTAWWNSTQNCRRKKNIRWR